MRPWAFLSQPREWMILKWIILFPSSYTSKGGEEETKKEKRKKHLWGSSSVIATGGFSSTDFRFQEKLYTINGVSMTHTHTRMEMVGKEEKKKPNYWSYLLFRRTLSNERRNGASNCHLNIDYNKQGEFYCTQKDYNKHKKNTWRDDEGI